MAELKTENAPKAARKPRAKTAPKAAKPASFDERLKGMASDAERMGDEPRQYALAHAVLGVSFVACSDNFQDGTQPTVLRLRTEDAKDKFVFETLRKGDKLHMELGGPNDRLALLATVRGVDVIRVPTFRMGNKDACDALVRSASGWEYGEESTVGEESSADLTARKVRALAIAAASKLHPEHFVPMQEQDLGKLLVKHYYRSYRAGQKVLLANYQRLLSTYNDQYLLELAVNGESAVMEHGRVATQAAMQAINAMLHAIPAEQREAFAARMGLEKLSKRHTLKRKDVMALFRTMIHELLEQDVATGSFMAHMGETVKRIEKLLKADPVYMAVFDPIPGIGPLIGARFVATIVDIRRFRSAAHLKAYAGYHHFEDGSRARRRKGKVSNWQTELKQATYLWTQQVIKMAGSPWRIKLDQRKAYELWKLLWAKQALAEAGGMDVQMLPDGFLLRTVENTNSMTCEDYGTLAAHLDALRIRAGVTSEKPDEEEDEEAGEEESAASTSVKDPELAKLVRGLKKSAQDKAFRWLGQQLLKHIFVTWRDVIGMSKNPATYRDAQGNLHFTRGSKVRDERAETYRRKYGTGPSPAVGVGEEPAPDFGADVTSDAIDKVA